MNVIVVRPLHLDDVIALIDVNVVVVLQGLVRVAPPGVLSLMIMNLERNKNKNSRNISQQTIIIIILSAKKDTFNNFCFNFLID